MKRTNRTFINGVLAVAAAADPCLSRLTGNQLMKGGFMITEFGEFFGRTLGLALVAALLAVCATTW